MRKMSRLSSDDCRALLDRARRAISSAVIEKRILDWLPFRAGLSEPAGAFVTLHRDGQLRGCVGQVESPEPLADTVARSAINAALHDSRFPAVEADEIKSLDIEISVISRPEPIAPETVVVGRDGLLVVKGEHRGLLLPQVASERRWPSQRFLEETCVNAGLPRDASPQPSPHVFPFSPELFSHTTLRQFSGS